ncbi:MAG: tetratricopeptide repeat protein [Planctomycetota bacterium]
MLDYAERRAPAERALSEALRLQNEGRYGDAERRYRRSIALFPTAEAYTFLGWALSFLDKHDEAIQTCKRAIELDPDFGNPYNDIGAYLIQLGKHELAIPWLERAKQARRYDCYHYPYYNLGRVFEMMGRFHDALKEYRGAVERAREKNVEYEHAIQAVARMEAILRRK